MKSSKLVFTLMVMMSSVMMFGVNQEKKWLHLQQKVATTTSLIAGSFVGFKGFKYMHQHYPYQCSYLTKKISWLAGAAFVICPAYYAMHHRISTEFQKQ